VRVETIGECTLYLGDARDILPTLPRFDACVTDPPYGIGMARRGTIGTSRLAPVKDYGKDDWDNEPCSPELIAQIRSISQWQIIFGGNFFELPPSSCWLVWDKLNTGDFADCELAWTNLPIAVRRIKFMWNGMLRQNGEERGDHPTQKPIGVMEWALGHLIDSHNVIDPFMGSGTTGVACARTGLKFTGIEREQKYHAAACRRIEEAYKQPRLFAEPAPKPQQVDLL
jgi:DNA modification methylase